MKLLPRILNRIAFVRAEFTSADECRTEVFMWRSGILSPTGRATAKNALAVLVVCGQGVVTKPEGCQVVARVEADPETFLWSSAGGATSFVRRERLQSVLAVLAAEGCVRSPCTVRTPRRTSDRPQGYMPGSWAIPSAGVCSSA